LTIVTHGLIYNPIN
jgi:DNA-binding response OmpR family regulator